jgi:glycosyltransferase involved in cell wall biosynthesis
MNTQAPFEKLVLIGNFEPDGQQSMLRLTRLFAEGFSARGRVVEVWSPAPFFSRLSPGGYRYGGFAKYLGYADKFVRFPRTLRRRARRQPPGTVFHITDHANAVYAPWLGGLPCVVTVNDLLQIRSARGEFPQNRISRTGTRYQRWILENLSKLRFAACISQKTREDLLRLASLPPDAATVISNSLNYPYRPMVVGEAAAVLAKHGVTPGDGPFFIGVGGAQWYKNRTGLISIFAALRRIPATSRHKLVYVGPEFDAEQMRIIADRKLGDAIVHLRDLDNVELNAAYSLARALIFPSWEEGFGWPIAEAQACGCPVFASNRAPMTEVGGGAAAYIDPADAQGAAAQIAGTLVVEEARMREAGLAEAARWNREIMLDKYEELYRGALARSFQSGSGPSGRFAEGKESEKAAETSASTL